MRRIVLCLLGLTLTMGMVGCSSEEKPADTAAPASTTPAETPATPAN